MSRITTSLLYWGTQPVRSIIFAHNKTVITHRYDYVHRKSKQIYRLKIARDSQYAKINCRFMYPQQFEYEMFLKDGNWDSIKNIKYLGIYLR